MPKGMYGANFPDVYKMFHNNLVSVSSDQYIVGGVLLTLYFYPPLHVSETGDLTAMRFNLYAQVEDAIAHARTKFDVFRIDIGIVNEPGHPGKPGIVEAHLYLSVTEKGSE